MYQAVYFEINFLCLLILCCVFLLSQRSKENRTQDIAFRHMVVADALVLFYDGVWIFLDGVSGSPFLYTLNYALNILYMVQTAYVSYCWLNYVCAQIAPDRKRSLRFRVLCAIPLVVYTSLCLSTPFTGLIFTVDEQNLYHRGSAFWLQLVVTYGFILVASLVSFRAMRRERNILRRREQKMQLLFFLLPTIGAVAMVFFKGVPLAWPAMTVTILVVFMKRQSYQISTDALTGLNNRRRFDQYAKEAAGSLRGDDQLFLLMLDVNAFKQINDTYGHVEGDNALRAVADLMRSVCNGRGSFLARYGGDEFAVLFVGQSISEAVDMKKCLNEECAQYGKRANAKWELSLSVGFGAYLPGFNDGIKRMVEDADRMLYNEKEKFRQKNESASR